RAFSRHASTRASSATAALIASASSRASWLTVPSIATLQCARTGAIVDTAVQGVKRRCARMPTMSGPFVRPDDRVERREPGDVEPGVFPYTRGIQPTMYRGRLWTMRQYAGFGTAAESNARYRFLLDQGVTGLSVAFDLPTQMGYDSDHPMAAGEVGRVGVPMDSIEDVARLFEG